MQLALENLLLSLSLGEEVVDSVLYTLVQYLLVSYYHSLLMILTTIIPHHNTTKYYCYVQIYN